MPLTDDRSPVLWLRFFCAQCTLAGHFFMLNPAADDARRDPSATTTSPASYPVGPGRDVHWSSLVVSRRFLAIDPAFFKLKSIAGSGSDTILAPARWSHPLHSEHDSTKSLGVDCYGIMAANIKPSLHFWNTHIWIDKKKYHVEEV
jgi:hypothetical protein